MENANEKKKPRKQKICKPTVNIFVDRFFGTGLTGSCTGTGFGTEPEPGIPVPDFYPPDPKRTEPVWNRNLIFDFDLKQEPDWNRIRFFAEPGNGHLYLKLGD